MASFGENGFNANAPENNKSNVIPKGEYPAILVESAVQQTKDGRGNRLHLVFQICGGEFQNKKVFEDLNLWLRRNEFKSDVEWEAALKLDSKTQQAVDIARAQLSNLSRDALNILNPKDSVELHNKPLILKLGVQEAQNGFPAKNKITGYKPRSAAQGQVAPPPPATPPVDQGQQTQAGVNPYA